MRNTMPTSLLALIALAAGAAAQNTFKVPQDFATIQAAVDAANDQDTILVSAGTYAESVVIDGGHLLSITGKGKVVIAPVAGDAVKIQDSDFVFLTNLRTQGGDVGFHMVDSSSCQLVKCRVAGSTGDGVRIEGGLSNAVLKVTVEDAGGDGIALATGLVDPTSNNTIIGCKLLAPALDGLGLNGSNNFVSACKIQDAGRDGINVEDTTPSADNQFQSCKILQPVRHGLQFTGNGMQVIHCTITAPGGRGVDFIDGTGGVVQQSKITKSGDAGIVVGGDGFTLDRAKLSKAATDGVLIFGDDVIVQKCKVSAAGVDGYEIQGLTGSFTGNKSSKAGQDGFLLQGSGNTLSANKASGSGNFDLDNPVPANNTVDADNKFKTTGP
jgi:Right handed beta helix region